ncbi:hypothetical protein P3S68_022620 [Capsicum galapagoense]
MLGLPFQHMVILPNYDNKYESLHTLSLASSTVHRMNIIASVNLGLESITRPFLFISLAITFAFWLGFTLGLIDKDQNLIEGLFSTIIATMRMLSITTYVLTMDMFRSIANNAGGIVGMTHQVMLIFF